LISSAGGHHEVVYVKSSAPFVYGWAKGAFFYAIGPPEPFHLISSIVINKVFMSTENTPLIGVKDFGR
jgi:hypothetical protein